MNAVIQGLDPAQLCRVCDPAVFDFATTADLPETADSFGQGRAEAALRFAVAMKRPGYNLFVLGEAGSGRHYMIRRLLEEAAARGDVPGDWCYVYNFDDEQKPNALQLPAGRGAQFKRDMSEFVLELGTTITGVFESDEYRNRIDAIQEALKGREDAALRDLGDEAGKHGIALLRTPHGFVFAPVKDDEAMSPDEFSKLPEEEQKRIGKTIEAHGEKLGKLLHQFPRWRRETQAKIREASREAMSMAVSHMVEELKGRYTDLPEVLAYLGAVERDVIETGEELRESQKSEGETITVTMTGSISLARYQVNLLIDHGATRASPIVFEDNPNYPNLVGRLDQVAHMGTLLTNFSMIRNGALHRANGGYLMLDAVKLLSQPYAYEGLKRVLKSGQIRIESLGQMIGVIGAASIEPEPIPADLKVILFGERLHYYMLQQYDPEFDELFKVAADFEDDIPRDDANTQLYAHLVGRLARAGGLRPFTREAVARLVEEAARVAGDSERLSIRTRRLADLMCEADHLAAAGAAAVGPQDIERALQAQIGRADRLRQQIQREVLRDTLLIASDGSHVGQVNGLAVIDLGDFRFAHPVRITATVRLGEGDVIDIERESELGGALHSKGVMILASFLGARFARSLPLSLAASLVFEQSYGLVEGDSASLAETCALLSALAEAPIRQSLAITGSVNQYGRVQAIGGVNEKIEGFFDICAARGLTGAQGVLIPDANVKHLMLRQDVVRACAEGRFHVYAVSTVDQAISLLSGVPAGEPDETGVVPEGSINYMVATQLAEMSLARQSFAAGPKRGRRKRGKDAQDEAPAPDQGRDPGAGNRGSDA